MALINCPKCGHTLSNTAKRCPHCGYAPTLKNNIHKKSSATKIFFLLIVVCAILIGLFFAYRVSQRKTDEIASKEYETIETKCAIEEPVEATVIDDPLCHVDSTNFHEVDGETLYLWLCKEREQGRDWILTESDANKLTGEQMATLGLVRHDVELVLDFEEEKEEKPTALQSTEIIIGDVDEVTIENGNVHAKEETTMPQQNPENTKVWPQSEVEETAKFPGGETALYKFIEENVNFPQTAKEEGAQGKVVVQFVIQKDGSVLSPMVVRGKHPSLDKEALRVVKNLPKFTPARVGGQAVSSTYTLPINFKI